MMAPRLERAAACRVILLGAAVALACGCSTEGRKSLLEEPRARVTSTRLADLGLEGARLLVGIEVENPMPFAIPIAGIEYEVTSEGRKLLGGKSDHKERIPAGSSREITVPVEIRFADVLAALEDVEAGSVIPYSADLGVGLDIPGGGMVRIPVRKEGKLPVPAMPSVDLKDIRFNELSMSSAKAAVDIEIVNKNSFELALSSLGYAISLAGFEVGRSTVDERAHFEPGGSDQVTINLSFAPRKLGLALFSALLQGKAAYTLEGMAHFDSPFGELDLPYRKVGEASFKGR